MSAFLSSAVLSLRPIERSDLEQLRQWRNDPELRQRTREWKALTSEDQERWFQRITSQHRHDHMFIVEHQNKALGVIGLCGWDMHNRHAEISFYIGDSEQRRKGFMKDALVLLIQWGFDQGLHRIWAETYAFNVPSIKLLEHLGFLHEGKLRQHVFRNGRFVDSLIMGLLKSDKKNSLNTKFDTAEIDGWQ